MKAEIRHILVPPPEKATSLIERISQSVAPLPENDYDGSTDFDAQMQSPQSSSGTVSNDNSHSRKIRQNASFHIHSLDMHPTKSILCFVETPSYSSPHMDTVTGNSTDRILLDPKQRIRKQRIFVQNFITRHILATISMNDICRSWISLHLANSATVTTPQHKNHKLDATIPLEKEAVLMQDAYHILGRIVSVKFMDLHTLQHVPSESTASLTPSSYSPSLLIQFLDRIIVYPLNQHNHYHNTSPSYTQMNPAHLYQNLRKPEPSNSYRFPSPSSPQSQTITEISKSKLNGTKPTSNAIPILSTNLLAVGCADGAMRFYSLLEGKICKSVRGPNGREDPVVKLLSIQGWDWDIACRGHFVARGKQRSSQPSTSDRGHGDKSKDGFDTRLLRIMTICASATAYLWELEVTMHIKTGSLEKFKIRAPLLKIDATGVLEGIKSLSSSSAAVVNSVATGDGGVVNNSFTISSAHHSIGMEPVHQQKIEFDQDRQCLMWTIRSSYLKPYLLVWDLSQKSILPLLAAARRKAKNEVGKVPDTPAHKPTSIVQIPIIDTMTNSQVDVMAGVIHTSFPDRALVSLIASRGGDLSLAASRCGGIGSVSRDSEVRIEKATIYNQFTFATMKRHSDQKAIGVLDMIDDYMLKLVTVCSSRSRPDIVVMVTNFGLVIINLQDEDSSRVCGAFHTSYSDGKGGYLGEIGKGDSIILVNESSVYTSSINFTPNEMKPNPIGIIQLNKDPILVYKSPVATNKSREFHQRPIRLPPKLIPSPSGKFLCLFWSAESRYEILHVDSMTSAARKTNRNSQEYTPAIEIGLDILSFAWVGDEDVFAVLYPPELNKADYQENISGPGKKEKTYKKRQVSVGIGDIVHDNGEVEENLRIDPSKFKPRVDLKVLVGVNEDAASFSGSIAAATASKLGTLTLRGRHSPIRLFGGPILCVGSISRDKDSSETDGMMRFYCRRPTADVNDIRASSYFSVGPSLPYADYVVWDDSGKLCCVVVGRRIAIYLADPPKFTLLGTSLLGAGNETDAKVFSAKFLHGVLFCSTQISIQCIFLGDIINDDVECEMDSFTIATVDAPFFPAWDAIQPHPVSSPLRCVNIINYIHGSLLVSSSTGLHAVPLDHPIFRIGTLLAVGYHSRAQQWFNAIEPKKHEALSIFLERRGAPEMAVKLPGLSVETISDLCLRYGFTEPLEYLVQVHGVRTLQKYDLGRGVDGIGGPSLTVSIGAYLLGQGKNELVKTMASDCLDFGEDGRRQSFAIASLLYAVEPNEAEPIIRRSLESDTPDMMAYSWPVGAFIRDNLLK